MQTRAQNVSKTQKNSVFFGWPLGWFYSHTDRFGLHRGWFSSHSDFFGVHDSKIYVFVITLFKAIGFNDLNSVKDQIISISKFQLLWSTYMICEIMADKKWTNLVPDFFKDLYAY